GVSTATIRKWEDKGLPFGRIGDQKFYDKEKCRAWVLAQ
ncbi:MerR family transcriptional regulator, partial [Enterococcus faecium]